MIPDGMAHGHFDIQTFETPGLTEERLNEILGPRNTRKPGTVDRLFAGKEPVQKAYGDNLVLHWWAATMFFHLMQGGDPGTPWNSGSTAAAWLGTIALETVDTEPTYTESVTGFVDINNTTDLVASGAGKRFIEDDVEDHLITSDPDGREAINIRNRWLFLPLDFSNNDIRSLSAWYAADADITAGQWRGRGARIRLKDSGGSPIIVNKTANQSLFIEYNFTLVSV